MKRASRARGESYADGFICHEELNVQNAKVHEAPINSAPSPINSLYSDALMSGSL